MLKIQRISILYQLLSEKVKMLTSNKCKATQLIFLCSLHTNKLDFSLGSVKIRMKGQDLDWRWIEIRSGNTSILNELKFKQTVF